MLRLIHVMPMIALYKYAKHAAVVIDRRTAHRRGLRPKSGTGTGLKVMHGDVYGEFLGDN